MDFKLIFGVVATLVALFAYYPYLRDIYLKKTQPHGYSWLVWTILSIVGVSAQLQGGAGYGAWASIAGTLICSVVFLLSLRYGTKNITKFDIICLVAAFLALGLYFFLSNPLWAVISITVIDFLGFLPTFRKGWNEPHSETISTFAISATSQFFSLLAIGNYSISTVLYVGSLLVTNSAFATLVFFRRRMLKN